MELRINPDGTLRYDGDFGRYVIRGDVLIIRIPDDSPERFRFSLRGDRLLLWETPHDDPIVLSRVGGSPRLRKAEAPKASGSSQQTGAPGGRSSADLQRSVQKPSGRSGAASSLPGGTRNVSPSPPSDEKQEGASGGPTSLPKTARVPGKRQAPGGEIFKSADGTLSFRLPQGWSAQEMNTRDFQGIVLNPGLKPGGILEARIVLSRQRVQCSDLRLGLARMAQSAIQDLLKQAPHLRPDGSPSIHPAGGGGGGGGRLTVTLSGRQPADGRPIRGWIGAVVKPPYSFPLIALIMGDRWAHYRPRLESVFASLQTRVPARNRRLERALVGQWRGIYAKTGGSGSSSREMLLNLSADMTFRSRYTSSLSARSGSYASSVGEQHDTGNWEVRGRSIYLGGRSGESAYDLKVEFQGGIVNNFQAAGMTFGRTGR